MRHVRLTCKNHPELRWMCKSIAFTPGYGYNGSRSIFFLGNAKDMESLADPDMRTECPCKGTELILAPDETWDKECES